MIPRDEIISMAKDAGFEFYGQRWDNQGHEVIYTAGDFAIARFAALVSARAAAIEREKNAIRCDAISNRYNKPDEAGYRIAAEWCAAEIRSAK